jgi:thioredoxin 1
VCRLAALDGGRWLAPPIHDTYPPTKTGETPMTPPTLMPTAVTDASFAGDVLASATTVLVDFWAQWCGPCHAVAPILEQIAAEHGDRLTVAKLDVDANPSTATQFEAYSIPTMIVFQNGEATTRLVGARPKAALLSELADYL